MTVPLYLFGNQLKSCTIEKALIPAKATIIVSVAYRMLLTNKYVLLSVYVI